MPGETGIDLSVIDEAYGKDADLYVDVLRVSGLSSPEEIKAAFFDRRSELFAILSKLSEDDMVDEITMSQRQFAEQRMDAVVMAFRILKDPHTRKRYASMRKARFQHKGDKSTTKTKTKTDTGRSTKISSRKKEQESERQDGPSPAAVSPEKELPTTSTAPRRSPVSVRETGGTPEPAPITDVEITTTKATTPTSKSRSTVVTPDKGILAASSSIDKDEQRTPSSGRQRNGQTQPRQEGIKITVEDSPPSRKHVKKITTGNKTKTRTSRRKPSSSSSTTTKTTATSTTSTTQRSLGVASASSSSSPDKTRSTSGRTTPPTDDSQDDDDYDDDDDDEIDDGDYTLDDTVVTNTRSYESYTIMNNTKKGFLQVVNEEVQGTCMDTYMAIDQVVNAFTLQESDINAVVGRINKVKKQLQGKTFRCCFCQVMMEMMDSTMGKADCPGF